MVNRNSIELYWNFLLILILKIAFLCLLRNRFLRFERRFDGNKIDARIIKNYAERK